MAVAFAAGLALHQAGGSLPVPLLLLTGPPLIAAWTRPAARPLLFAVVAGTAAGFAHRAGTCETPRIGAPVTLSGWFLAEPRGTGTVAFAVAEPCPGSSRVMASEDAPGAGVPVRVSGVWREGRFAPWVLARETEPWERARWGDPRPAAVRWRTGLVSRLERLYGPRAGLVSALVLARRDGLEPGLRDTFARSGTAHLLAISGFHVGVFAALVVAALRLARVGGRRAGLLGALLVWGYVAFIGFPDAAVRAALIFFLVAIFRLRGRPPARLGAWGTALLLFLALDPAALSRVGFQLSFAGAAGLLVWGPGLRDALLRVTRGRCPAELAAAVAAGIAATAATLPFVAWHFERVSVVGIPATLLAAPLVALALPGALATLALAPLWPAGAAFLAGGVDTLLLALEAVVSLAAAPAWSSVWIPRSWVVLGTGSLVLAGRLPGLAVRGRARKPVAVLVAVAVVVAWPLVRVAVDRGTVELIAVDVGQGDALALRTPAGRWVVVDAGPPAPFPPGAVTSLLGRRGVGRLEVLVLTHPHLDHIGEARALLERLDVGEVVDPAQPSGNPEYVALLRAARARGVPWRRAAAGERWEVDGVTFEVLHPGGGRVEPSDDPNDVSVVLWVRYGAFDALLTGDVPAAVEHELAARFHGGVEVLKVAHHGSDTSSDSLFLGRTAPSVALVSVGRGNRYGHPSDDVMRRLAGVGASVLRTDRDGMVTILGRRSGALEVTRERRARGSRH